MNIAVIPNAASTEAVALLEEVCGLLKKAGIIPQPLVLSDGLPDASAILAAVADCQAAVAIGGDGTILHVAKAVAPVGCPVLGINAGRLGFLAGLERSELAALPGLWQEKYTVEERALIEVTVCRGDDGSVEGPYFAMNEVVVSRGTLSQLVDIAVTDKGRELLSCRGDGVIIASPTGSTAYSLSAGGPVIDPGVDCLLVNPICPHTVVARAYVLPGEAALEVKAFSRDGKNAYLTVDGEENIPLAKEDRVLVHRAALSARLIRLKNTTVSDILSEKMLGRRTV